MVCCTRKLLTPNNLTTPGDLPGAGCVFAGSRERGEVAAFAVGGAVPAGGEEPFVEVTAADLDGELRSVDLEWDFRARFQIALPYSCRKYGYRPLG